ncbi:MAG: hypothetical protein GTO49_12575, partial [Anaerolineae bacterium]|nr:hypothetical protein [Anaerolineae bacterium]
MNEQRTEEQHDMPKVDLNTATVEELTQLLGIGLKMARRIIEYRETVRPFEELEDLMAVPGIGGETYRRLADRLTVSPAAQPPAEEVKPRPTIKEAEERPSIGGEEPPPPAEPEPPAKEERVEAEEPPTREPPPPREAPAEVERPPAVVQPPAPSAWRGGFTWLAAASLIGAVMGAILALLVIAGI